MVNSAEIEEYMRAMENGLSEVNMFDYNISKKHIDYFIGKFNSLSDKLLALDYVLFVFRTEYAARARIRVFQWRNPDALSDPTPTHYLVDGTEIFIEPDEQQQVNLSRDISIIAGAWKTDRLTNAPQREYNHHMKYYPYLNLAFVYGGNHSISAGIYFKQGDVLADVYDITKLFEHLDTDGICWIDRHTGKNISKVTDSFFALLYTIGQTKFFCEHSQIK